MLTGLRREVLEETGHHIVPGPLLFWVTRKTQEKLLLFFHGRVRSAGALDYGRHREITAATYAAVDALPSPRSPAFRDYLAASAANSISSPAIDADPNPAKSPMWWFRKKPAASAAPATPSIPPATSGLWISVDLDGTLARFEGWRGPEHIGPPIVSMLRRVLAWVAEDRRVKIFTARAGLPAAIEPLRTWLHAQGLPDLEITNVKDFDMEELWDDRAIAVLHNDGGVAPGVLRFARHRPAAGTPRVEPTPMVPHHADTALTPVPSNFPAKSLSP